EEDVRVDLADELHDLVEVLRTAGRAVEPSAEPDVERHGTDRNPGGGRGGPVSLRVRSCAVHGRALCLSTVAGARASAHSTVAGPGKRPLDGGRSGQAPT